MTADRPADPLAPLALRIRDGDIGAFETVFRALHAPLCEVVDGYVRSQAIAEELVQDLFLKVWVDRARMPAAHSLRAYLFTSARNRALHHLRHRAVAHRWAERSEFERVPSEADRAPDQVLETDEARRAVRRAVDGLSPRTRVAFVLQWEYEMSHAEIATAMGISTKGVEKLLSAAKAKLRALLGPHRGALPDGGGSPFLP